MISTTNLKRRRHSFNNRLLKLNMTKKTYVKYPLAQLLSTYILRNFTIPTLPVKEYIVGHSEVFCSISQMQEIIYCIESRTSEQLFKVLPLIIYTSWNVRQIWVTTSPCWIIVVIAYEVQYDLERGLLHDLELKN